MSNNHNKDVIYFKTKNIIRIIDVMNINNISKRNILYIHIK